MGTKSGNMKVGESMEKSSKSKKVNSKGYKSDKVNKSKNRT